MNFSKRYGYKPVKDIVQIESMDDDLRNSLWNALKVSCWDKVYSPYSGANLGSSSNSCHLQLFQNLWISFFKQPLDSLHYNWNLTHSKIHDYFFSCEWYEVYDFIEFIANNYKGIAFKEDFIKGCNHFLKQEVSAYRFIDGQITRITDESEISEIESALSSKPSVSQHLNRSLELLSDKGNPDYRNSIKESVSAVESLVLLQLGTSGTLGSLLNQLENNFALHSSLKEAFKKLYGYTSDESGIRHALKDKDKVDFHDAKFMLVACSAFINYIKGKSEDK